MSNIDARTETIARNLLKAQSDYLEELEQAHAEGFRPQYCFHGASLWVDYDVMCPGCEDGWVNQYSTVAEVLEYARHTAENDVLQEKARRDRDHSHALMVHEFVVSGGVTTAQAGVL